MKTTQHDVFEEDIIQMAKETLVTLKDYSEILENLSHQAANLVGQDDFQKSFVKLLDGIRTFTDSVAQVKSVLNSKRNDTVSVLETDLTSILKNLLDSQEKADLTQKTELLKTHLPANLNQWRTIGLSSIE